MMTEKQIIIGKCLSVTDGDTIKCTLVQNMSKYSFHKPLIKIRISGIDSPELDHQNMENSQQFGVEARKAMADMVLDKEVVIEILAKDRYRRYLCIVYTKDEINTNLSMLKLGLADMYKGPNAHYGEFERQFKDALEQAKKNKVGMWSVDDVITPYEYKKNKKNSHRDRLDIETSESCIHGL
ncbi:Y1296 [Enterospora canceri]|uniref:Y1296 n=1 Tax=Enterospora canceri TaxID=1081671 RepID=A0A1Y1S9K2_9MICR|nr:Y1296 [Enterospora canceri]